MFSSSKGERNVQHEATKNDSENREDREQPHSERKIAQRTTLLAESLVETNVDTGDRSPSDESEDPGQVEQPGEGGSGSPDGSQEGEEGHGSDETGKEGAV